MFSDQTLEHGKNGSEKNDYRTQNLLRRLARRPRAYSATLRKR
jgi:hypothetical protein